ncbi:MAG: ATP-grasp domain-containing protein [Bacteroidales bacterium]|nr:ATP-grasp domain-containing protein [Bacteroidales bacterium]
MIILDKPYVSEFLLKTIRENKFSVVQTQSTSKWMTENDPLVISGEQAAKRRREFVEPVYTNSENAIGWIEQNPEFSYLAEKIKLFKNKVAFRELLKKDFPDYFFQAVALSELPDLDVSNFSLPFIIKPSVGFFSMGVYKVNNVHEWPGILQNIQKEIITNKNIYPEEVYNDSEFIVEEVINGDEFAIDCYVNDTGEVVVLNIMQHVFSSGDDVGDRLYFTSARVMNLYLKPVTVFLQKMAGSADLKQFPMHVELRIDEKGNIMPIEVNPLRFGGWCTTADLAFYAYGFNAYEQYFLQQKPNWDQILKKSDGKTHCIVVLDNSTGYSEDQIRTFDYEKLTSGFRKVWELRKVNYKEYPLFGMLFIATENENSDEVLRILHSDLREFIQVTGS